MRLSIQIIGLFVVILIILLMKIAYTQSIEWMWSGGVTSQSARVNVKISQNSPNVRLFVSLQPDMHSPIISDVYTADTATNNRVVSIPLTDLSTNTQYYYAIEIDGNLDLTKVGRFKTFPSGPSSFSIAMGACAETGSSHQVFNTIQDTSPLFFLHMGDMHYENIAVNDPDEFRAAYDEVLTSQTQAELYQNVPIAYMWDDHDYGPNDSDARSPGREAARLTYQAYVPHYPLVEGSGDVAIYQAFTVGRVRFILTDVRSERSPKDMIDDASKTMLGARQKAWFKQELLSSNEVYLLIVWVNTVPWISEGITSDDAWGSYTTERAELANFIQGNDIQGLVMISGDAHMLAIDDGTNSNYGDQVKPGFPILHAAALDRSGAIKGGPYSEGAFPGGGQFGLMTITDDGGETINVEWKGLDDEQNEIVRLNFVSP